MNKTKRILFSLFALFSIVAGAKAEGETAYAVWCADNTTLYFTNRAETLTAGNTFTPEGSAETVTITNVWSGTEVTATSTSGTPGWNNTVKNTMTAVVFESSFANVTPNSLRGWFYQCSKLISEQGIENLNTSAATNMAYMFSGCNSASFTSLDLRSFSTDNVTDMQCMFSNTKLSSIDLSGWTNIKVTNMYAMFYRCSNLTMLNLTGFSTATVTNMESMFQECTSMTAFNLSNFNTGSVTNMKSMFKSCTNLVSIDLSSFNTENVTTVQEMFSGCINLESINLSGWTNTKLTTLTNMFRDCKKLSDLTLTNFSIQAATSFNSMFVNCQALESIDLSGFNTEKVTDMQYMFYGCSALQNLDLSTFNTGTVTSMYQMFYNCTGLQSINLSGWTNTKLTNTSQMFYGCSGLASLNLTNFNTAAIQNMSYMFAGCKALTSLNLGNFDTGNVTNMDYMFQNCQLLGGLDLSSFNTAKVTNMQNMFDGCNALSTLNVSNFNTALVTNMSCMFQNCQTLRELELSSFNTSKVTNMSSMFNGCTNLKDIYVSLAWTTGVVNSSSNMFKGCTSLVGEDGTTLATYNNSSLDRTHATDEAGGYMKTGVTTELDEPQSYAIWCADNTTLYFLQSKKQLVTGRSFTPNGSTTPVKMTTVWSGTQVTATGNSNPAWLNTVKTILQHVVFEPSFATATPNSLYAWFYQCTALTTIQGFNYLNTANITNMAYMFSGATAIQSLDLSSLNTANVTNMSYMFQNCSNLQSLNLTGLNTAKVTNMSYMFQNCSNLQSLNVTYFNTAKVQNMQYMFNNCSSLTAIDMSSFTMESINNLNYMFAGCSNLATLQLSSFNIGTRSPSITSMFEGCTLLQSIFVSNLWTLAKRTDANTFKDCPALVGEDGTTYNSDAMTAAKAHYGAGGYLRKGTQTPDNENPTNYAIYCDDNNTIYYTYSKQPLQTGSVFMPEGETTGHVVTVIYQSANGNATDGQKWASNSAKNATTVVFESSYSQLKPTSMYRTFKGLAALTNIRGLEYLNTEDVTNMQETFYGCSSLTSLDLKTFNTENVFYTTYMFYNCSSLQSLDISSFITTATTRTYYMFYGCSALQNIYVGDGWTTASVSVDNSNYMFTGCTSLPNFDASVINKTNAHPYEGGYLREGTSTPIVPTPYVVWNDEGKTLYFLRSNKLLVAGRRFTPTGSDTAVGIDAVWNNAANTGTANPGWIASTGIRDAIKQVVIDPSFADVRPTSTYRWFYYCYALEGITGLEYLNTSEVTTMNQMFYRCEKLTTLDLRGWNTEKVTDMYNMFGECSALETLDLSTFRTPKVTTLQFIFYNCKVLKSLDLSGFSNEELTNANNMFSYCTALETINMAGFGIGKLTSLEYLFNGCPAVRSLDLHTMNTANVTKLYAMFSGCKALESVNLSGWNTEKVTTMGWMFYGCKALKSIDLSTLRGPELTDMSYMFDGCASLESIDLSGLGQTKVSSVYSMFDGCSSVKTLNLTGFGTGKISSTANLFKGMESLESIDLSGVNLSAVTSTEYMFDGCMKLKSVSLTGQTGAVRSTTGMFRDCNSLEALDISGLQISDELRDYYQMFMDCVSLKTVDITPLSGGRPWTLEQMFSGCSSLESIDVSPLYMGFVQSTEEMFKDCSSLKGIDFSGMSGYNLNDMDYMFEGCTSLESVNLDMQNLGYAASRSTTTSVFINGLFKDCSSLKSINLLPLRSMTINSHTKIEMFSGCASLESLDLSEFYTTSNTNLYGLFAGCSSLKELNLSTFDTQEVTDMSEMFKGCTQLQSIYIESKWTTDAVTESSDMFTGCTALVGQDGSTISSTPTVDVTRAHANAGGLMRMLSIPYAIYCDDSKTLYLTVRDVLYHVGDKFTPAGSTEPLTVTCVQLKDDLLKSNSYGLLQEEAANAQSVVIEESFATQKPTNTSRWFKGGSNLQTITGLEHLNTSEVTYMYAMFEDCSSLTTLDLSTFDLSMVENMGNMFKGCSNLQSINFVFDPEDTHGYTDQLHYMSGMFRDCLRLKTINLQNFVTVGVTDMSYLFYRCQSLQSINFGLNWVTRSVQDMQYMFSECNNLAAIDLSRFSNLACRNMTAMFNNCSSLTELDMSTFAGYYDESPLTLTNVYYMFNGCKNLKTIYIGDEWVNHYSDYYQGVGTMFSGCTRIVGEKGITYNASYTGFERANAEDGYFTYKGVSVTIPASGVTTFSAPYKVVVPEGLSAYIAPDYEGDESILQLDQLRSTNLSGTDYTIIPAHTGVLLRGEPGLLSKLIATEKTELYTISSPTFEHNMLVAVTNPTHIAATSGDMTNFSLVGNRFIPISGNGADLATNTAYLPVLTTAFGNHEFIKLPWENMETICGDVNGDGIVTITDATLVVDSLSTGIPLNGNAREAADTNGDGEITYTDVVNILNMILTQ